MALFLAGKSNCAICGKPVAAAEERVLFPPFVANKRDPLFHLSDGVVHRACLDRDPLGAEALSRREEALAQSVPSARVCVMCSTVVTDPDDYFGTGFLGATASALGRFNYLHLHRSHFSGWSLASEFRGAVAAHLSLPGWEGPTVVFDPLPRWARSAPR